MIQVGKRYVSAGGAEMIITKAGPGELSDGTRALYLKGEEPAEVSAALPATTSSPVLQLGKRYRSADGAVELLVINPGPCAVRFDGEPMELMQPKVLPSAD